MAKSVSQKDDTRQSGKEQFRLFLLDALFQEEKFYSKEEVCDRLEVSVATLNRDMEEENPWYDEVFVDKSGTLTKRYSRRIYCFSS
ncbi:hypothetical protein [uncultured Treponema sp.]|uniref:hypothetical protein n=1 Tax=uncultured Treponema sp. TaxID=162155 RepID=UPI0025DCD40B|nr:hypothetical protein [uncultured Treponema sp.]